MALTVSESVAPATTRAGVTTCELFPGVQMVTVRFVVLRVHAAAGRPIASMEPRMAKATNVRRIKHFERVEIRGDLMTPCLDANGRLGCLFVRF